MWCGYVELYDVVSIPAFVEGQFIVWEDGDISRVYDPTKEELRFVLNREVVEVYVLRASVFLWDVFILDSLNA